MKFTYNMLNILDTGNSYCLVIHTLQILWTTQNGRHECIRYKVCQQSCRLNDAFSGTKNPTHIFIISLWDNRFPHSQFAFQSHSNYIYVQTCYTVLARPSLFSDIFYYTVARRHAARQRPRNKQIYNSHCKQACFHGSCTTTDKWWFLRGPFRWIRM
jgi:hypothetical protein